MMGAGRALAGAAAPLHAGARVVRRLLEGALGDRVALQADRQPRRVHHDEHVFEAAIGLADQVAHGAIAFAERHHAGGTGMDAELVFDRHAAQVIARAEFAVCSPTRTFGTRNSEMPRTPSGAPSMRASTMCMMLSVKSCSPQVMKIFWPKRRNSSTAGRPPGHLGHGARADQRQIGAGLRLGEHHGAGPLAAHHLRQKALLQRRRRRSVPGHGSPRRSASDTA